MVTLCLTPQSFTSGFVFFFKRSKQMLQDLNICLISIVHGCQRWEWGWVFYYFLYVWNVLKFKKMQRKRKCPRQVSRIGQPAENSIMETKGKGGPYSVLQSWLLPTGLRGCTSSGLASPHEWHERKPALWGHALPNSKSGYAREWQQVVLAGKVALLRGLGTSGPYQ